LWTAEEGCTRLIVALCTSYGHENYIRRVIIKLHELVATEN